MGLSEDGRAEEQGSVKPPEGGDADELADVLHLPRRASSGRGAQES